MFSAESARWEFIILFLFDNKIYGVFLISMWKITRFKGIWKIYGAFHVFTCTKHSEDIANRARVRAGINCDISAIERLDEDEAD